MNYELFVETLNDLDLEMRIHQVTLHDFQHTDRYVGYSPKAILARVEETERAIEEIVRRQKALKNELSKEMNLNQFTVNQLKEFAVASGMDKSELNGLKKSQVIKMLELKKGFVDYYFGTLKGETK